jgi:hypothetical protein
MLIIINGKGEKGKHAGSRPAKNVNVSANVQLGSSPGVAGRWHLTISLR